MHAESEFAAARFGTYGEIATNAIHRPPPTSTQGHMIHG